MANRVYPIYAISGSQGLLRRRQVQSVVQEQESHGWRIDHIDGAIKGAVRAALCQNGVFFNDRILVVVTHPDKADLSLYESHLSVTNPDVVLLLHYEGDPKGNTKFGKFLKDLGKRHQSFPVPKKQWEAQKAAVQFCVQEAKCHGKVLSESLAVFLVNYLGTDFGFLSFELYKMSILADLDGVDEITAEHVRAAMALISEVNAFMLTDAMATRDVKHVMRVLTSIKRTSKKDPTMGLCRLVGKQVVQWVAIKSLTSRGISAKESAQRLGMNSWYFSNKLLPKTSKWSLSDLQRLVHAVSQSERGVLKGALDPWSGFVARVMDVCGPQ